MNKHTEAQLERVLNNLAVVKDYKGKLAEILSPDKDRFWEALKAIIKKSREGHLKEVLNTLQEQDMTHPEINHLKVKFLAGAIHAYDEVLSLVDKNKALEEQACEKIKEIEEVAERIKSNIELQ